MLTIWKENSLWKIMLWKSYVEFRYAMGFLRKNAILVDKIGVDDQEGDDEPKGFQKHL